MDKNLRDQPLKIFRLLDMEWNLLTALMAFPLLQTNTFTPLG